MSNIHSAQKQKVSDKRETSRVECERLSENAEHLCNQTMLKNRKQLPSNRFTMAAIHVLTLKLRMPDIPNLATNTKQ